MDVRDLTPSQRQVRMNVRNAFLTASLAELAAALPNYPDEFTRDCIRELIDEADAETTSGGKPVIVHYIVRDVTPDAARYCSYPPGRTLLNRGPCYDDPDRARQDADRANECCTMAGVVYAVVPWDENLPFPADQYEQP